MSCDKFRIWIDDEASGALGARERERLHAHLASCAPCRAWREGTVDLAAHLGRIRRGVPAVDVRARVMRTICAEAEATRRRLVSAPVFWGSMSCAFAIVCALAELAARTASALPGEVLPAAGRAVRLGSDLWSVLRFLAGASRAVTSGVLEAAGHALASLAPALPKLEAVTFALMVITFVCAALPVARALWPARALRGASGR